MPPRPGWHYVGMAKDTPQTEISAAQQEGLRVYLKLARKAAEVELSEAELAEFNAVMDNHDISGLDLLLGTKYTTLAPRSVAVEVTVGPQHLQPWGLANGGLYCALGESAGSIAAFLAAGARPPVAGVNNNTDFFRSARAGDVIQSVATPLHLGRSAHVWEIVHTRKADGKLLARTNLRVAMLER